MFYPSEHLKRGGRFYLCWVADSWPLRFATITHKQLWSQDIRDICHDLQEVMVVESGKATARFSLRLSSQLLRGIVRLYQRKVTVILGDLCMINAKISKLINQKYSDEPPQQRHHRERTPKQPRVRIVEIPDNEERVEERIQNSGNAVANLDEITLREAVITEIQLPNDNFGEENPEQAFQLLNDRTLEIMLARTDTSVAQHSGLDVQLETSDKTADKTRLHPGDLQMENISEHELTFRKSTALGDITMPAEELDKDMPQIPEILPTDLPVPTPPKETHTEPVAEDPPQKEVEEPARKSDESLHLLELCSQDLEPAKRRRLKKLIVDKKIEISGNVIRARLENVAIELRCEDSSSDIVDPYRLSHIHYFRRPTHAGWRLGSRLAAPLDYMFQRNLGHRPTNTASDKEQELLSADDMRHRKNRTTPSKIIIEHKEIDGPIPRPTPEAIQPDLEMIIEPLMPELVLEDPSVENKENIDISDLPTQVLASVSQGHKATKRQAPELDLLPPSKRPRACGVVSSKKWAEEKRAGAFGYVSYKLSQRLSQEEELNVREPVHNIIQPEVQQDQIPAPLDETTKDPNDQHQVTQMLEQAGLADAPPIPVVPSIVVSASARPSRKDISDDSSETQLGSLDRTQIDLGESEKTTDSQRFLRKEWGTQGTMFKIIKLVQNGISPVTVRELVEFGPKDNGPRSMIAARCFTALLKLKQHNFINLEKDVETYEITNISLGPRFQNNS